MLHSLTFNEEHFICLIGIIISDKDILARHFHLDVMLYNSTLNVLDLKCVSICINYILCIVFKINL
jgi:hypothetical protein